MKKYFIVDLYDSEDNDSMFEVGQCLFALLVEEHP